MDRPSFGICFARFWELGKRCGIKLKIRKLIAFISFLVKSIICLSEPVRSIELKEMYRQKATILHREQ